MSKKLSTQPSHAFSMDDFNNITFFTMCKKLAPPLTAGYKTTPVKIGVFGGCVEFTGHTYFAAISALKTGADEVHVFCPKESAHYFRTSSPVLKVHPYLNSKNATKKIKPCLDELQVILIGPGLGRYREIFDVIRKVIYICRLMCKPLVIDGDGLHLLSLQQMEEIKDYPPPGIVLTPNFLEFLQLFGLDEMPNLENDMERMKFFKNAGLNKYVTILKKGDVDEILDCAKIVKVTDGGSGRRCGGQGYILAGSLTTFLAWAFLHKRDMELFHDDRAMIACCAASTLTRECNTEAFAKKKRSMTCTDMIEEIGYVFKKLFEFKCNFPHT